MADGAGAPMRGLAPDLWAGLASACAQAGIDPRDMRLLRSYTNHVVALPRARLVARVARPGVEAAEVEETLRVVRWAVEAGLPAGRPWEGCAVPMTLADGRLCTFWHLLDEPDRPAYVELGQVLRRLHDAAPPPGLLGRPFDPVAAARQVVQVPFPLAEGDRAFAADRITTLAAWYEADGAALPRGLVHGDAHLGNVLLDAGRPVLCDWDLACVGVLAWDLLPTAVEPQRWGRDWADYRRFADSYGADVMRWPDYLALRELFEWRTIGDRMRLATVKPELGALVPHLISTMRPGASAERWYG